MHCIALVGAVNDGRQGFAVRIGGGLSTVPRLSKNLGVFVPEAETMDVLRAILDAWKETPQVPPVPGQGAAQVHGRRLRPGAVPRAGRGALGRRLEDLAPPVARAAASTSRHPRAAAGGPDYIGFPVTAGWMNGEQMPAHRGHGRADGGDMRLTREQNFILTHIPTDARGRGRRARSTRIGFPLDVEPAAAASSIGCTGSPLCNYAVAETKLRLGEIMDHLEAAFGARGGHAADSPRRLPARLRASTGPGDIGLQGTTLRERGAAGEKQEGYEIYLRGGQAARAAIGRPVVRRVPGDQVNAHVERLLRLLDRRAARGRGLPRVHRSAAATTS